MEGLLKLIAAIPRRMGLPSIAYTSERMIFRAKMISVSTLFLRALSKTLLGTPSLPPGCFTGFGTRKSPGAPGCRMSPRTVVVQNMDNDPVSS